MTVQSYTGEILDDDRGDRSEYSEVNQEIEFTPEQHQIWAALFSGIQQPHLTFAVSGTRG